MSLYLHLTSDVHCDKGPIYARIREFLKEGGFDQRVFYLVPDNQKLASEFEVLKQLNRLDGREKYAANGMMRLQVFGFRRLAWYLGLDVSDQTISEIGLAMILKKITQSSHDQLKLFQRESRYLSFQERLVELFNEFERGNIPAVSFQQMVDQMELDGHASATQQNEWKKMRELAFIYNSYEEYLQVHPLRDLTIYDRLVATIAKEDFSKTLVVIDGFEQMHADEYRVVEALLQSKSEVIVSLTIPTDCESGEVDPQDLFYSPKRLQQQLAQMNGGTYRHLPSTAFSTSESYTPGFRTIEQWLIQEQQGEFSEKEWQGVANAISLWKSESPQVEADQVASQIYHLVSDPTSEYRYQDFHIFVRDFEQYQTVLLPALEQNQIPYFVDYPQVMAKHPLARFMHHLHYIYQNNWRYQDLFSLLRTYLLADTWPEGEDVTYQEALDLTENVVLTHGYEGRNLWHPDFIWQISPDSRHHKKPSDTDLKKERIIQLFKNRTYNALTPLFSHWQTAKTGEEAVRALYQFLTVNLVPNQIQQWATDLNEAGNIEEAEHQTQVWQKFVDVLDEYVLLFGEEPFESEDFFQILASAFEQTTYRIVPPTLDSVTITDFAGVPVTPNKIGFILGLTDQILPLKQTQTSLLNDEDRALLTSHLGENQALNPTPSELFNNEKLIAYHLFLAVTDHLYVSYPYNKLGEKETKPSMYWEHLKDTFHLNTIIKAAEGDWSHWPNQREIPQLVLGNWQTQLHHLVIQERQAKEQKTPLTPSWQKVEQALLRYGQQEPLIQTVLNSLTYQNRVQSLTPTLAKQLYGSTLTASVSNLELYNRDPFSYFLQYGLKLNERSHFEVDQRLTGTYSHEVMQRYYDRLLQYPDESFDERLQAVFELIQDLPSYEIFHRKPTFAFQQRQLNETLTQTLAREYQHQQAVTLQNWYNEWTFGRGDLTLTLPTCASVNLTGKIDRVDAIWKADPETGTPTLYFDVIDYKSSLRQRVSQLTNLGNLYDGTSLQLYTYLAVVWEAFNHQKYWREQPETLTGPADFETWPIGIFYDELSNIATDSHLQVTDEATWQQLHQPNSERSDVQQLGRLNGYLLEDIPALKLVSQEPEQLSAKQVYRFKLTNAGAFSNGSGLTNRLSPEQFVELVQFVKAKIAETVEHIQAGLIPLSPIADDPYLPSLTTFRSVARYDATDTDLPRVARTRFDSRQAVDAFFQQIALDDEEKAIDPTENQEVPFSNQAHRKDDTNE